MHLQQVSINGEDFVGLLGFATDRYAVLSENFRKTDVLDVPVLKTRIYGTNLVGMLCSGNSNGLLVPYFVSDEDIGKIKKFLNESGLDINIGRLFDRYTAIGNMIACNDKAAIVSHDISDVNAIRDVLDIEITRDYIANHREVGACCIATNKGFLVHPDAKDEIDKISDILGVKGDTGSVNFGFPFVKSGIIANSHGYITGFRTTGIELGRIDDALGFL